jgi:hypothetical protein
MATPRNPIAYIFERIGGRARIIYVKQNSKARRLPLPIHRLEPDPGEHRQRFTNQLVMKTVLTSIALTLLTATAAFPWGEQGHKAIWATAQSALTPTATLMVSQILNHDKLAMTAIWLDHVRSAQRHGTGPLKTNQEALDFIGSFPHNTNWHFVDLPLGATSYDPNDVDFAASDDVVHALNFCISVLEGNDTSLSKKIALRVIVHLVGDIHQPLHCGSGYFDVTDETHPLLKTSAQDAKPLLQFTDRGGNQLRFGPGKFDELHGMWDAELVRLEVGGSGSYLELVEVLKDDIAVTQVNDGADLHDWAKQWAGESAKLANDAYKKLNFGIAKLNAGKTKIESIQLSFTNGIDDYEDVEKDVALHQMTKAAIRLANLLNKVLK